MLALSFFTLVFVLFIFDSWCIFNCLNIFCILIDYAISSTSGYESEPETPSSKEQSITPIPSGYMDYYKKDSTFIIGYSLVS